VIYNKKLVNGTPPTQLSDLISFHQRLKSEHPGMNSILWDYSSPYYSWGILASGGGYIFGKTNDGYNPRDVGVATDGAVQALSEIVHLIDIGVLPRMASSGSIPQELMAQGKLAMMISGPWDWPNLMKSGIDFGVAPIARDKRQIGKSVHWRFGCLCQSQFAESRPRKRIPGEICLDQRELVRVGSCQADWNPRDDFARR